MLALFYEQLEVWEPLKKPMDWVEILLWSLEVLQKLVKYILELENILCVATTAAILCQFQKGF